MSARFTSADDTDGNGSGDDPYAYVKGNPETATDPTGNRMVSEDGSSANAVSVGGGVTRLVVDDPYGVITTRYSTSNYSNWSCTYNCYRNSTWSYSGYANYYGHQIPYTPPPKPKSTASARHPSMAQKAKAVAKTVATGAVHVVDTVFGVSRSIHDAQTLAGNGSAGEKAAAALDLGFNVLTDISMFTGEGEELRAADLAAEGGLDLAKGAAEDGALTEIEDGAKSLGEACGFLSFSYTTVVTTAVSKVAIGSLKPGEQVLAYNQQTKKMELEVIRHVWVTHDNDLVDLTLTHKTAASKGKPAQQNSETIHTNMKHPFLTVEKGFVPVGQLKLGMHIIEVGGRIGVVTGWQSKPDIQVMYNLEVTSDHTYTVGAGQWVVHNSCGRTLQLIRRDWMLFGHGLTSSLCVVGNCK